MRKNNQQLFSCGTKTIKLFGLVVFFVLLCLPLIADAQLTGRIAYAVTGFNQQLGRIDFNLHMTTFTEDGDFKTVPLNQSGLYPVWGPEDDTLYFIQRQDKLSHIFSIDINNPRNKTQLTQIGGTYRFLAISPNGKKLAFNGWTAEQQQQENQVWILDIDTGEMQPVTAVPHFGRSFFFNGISWDPTSKKLVFSLERPGGLDQLYLLDTETLEIEVLTEFNIDFYPVWSPDGQRILFRRWGREFHTIYTIDVETRIITPVLDVDSRAGMWTDWSFDGQSIIYSMWGIFYLFDLNKEKTEELFEVEGGIFGISWWRQEVLPVEPKQKLTTTWGDVKHTIR